jgi:hypothetical protein
MQNLQFAKTYEDLKLSIEFVKLRTGYRVPTLPGKREKSGNSVYAFHGREQSLNFTEIAKIRGKIGNFIAGQGSFGCTVHL